MAKSQAEKVIYALANQLGTDDCDYYRKEEYKEFEEGKANLGYDEAMKQGSREFCSERGLEDPTNPLYQALYQGYYDGLTMQLNHEYDY